MRKLLPFMVIATGFLIAFIPHFYLPMDYYRTLTNAFDRPIPRWWTHTELYLGIIVMGAGSVAAVLPRARRNMYGLSAVLCGLAVIQGILLIPFSRWTWWIPDYERDYQAAVVALHRGITPTLVCLGLIGMFVSYAGYRYTLSGPPARTRLTTLSLAMSNFTRKPFRTGAVSMMSAVAAAIMFVGGYVLITTLDSSRLALSKLGADVLVVPQDRLPETKKVFLSGEPLEFVMPSGTFERVASADGVMKASPQLFIRALPYRGCCTMMNTLIVAVDPDTDFTVFPWMEYSTQEGIGIGQVVVGRHVMFAPGQRIQYFDRYLRVIGMLNGTGLDFFDESSFISFEMAYELARTFPDPEQGGIRYAPGAYSAVLVKASPGTDPDELAKSLQAEIPGVAALSVKSLIPPARAMLVDATAQLWPLLMSTWAFCFLIQFVVFAMMFNERLRETGVLRALGATRRGVMKLFMAESCLIIVSGSLAGVAAGWLISLAYRYRLTMLSENHYVWMGQGGIALLALACVATGIVVGVCSALFPAYRAAGLEPYEAIRSGE